MALALPVLSQEPLHLWRSSARQCMHACMHVKVAQFKEKNGFLHTVVFWCARIWQTQEFSSTFSLNENWLYTKIIRSSNVEALNFVKFVVDLATIACKLFPFLPYIQEGDWGVVQGDDREDKGAQTTHCLLQWQGNLWKLLWWQVWLGTAAWTNTWD